MRAAESLNTMLLKKISLSLIYMLKGSGIKVNSYYITALECIFFILSGQKTQCRCEQKSISASLYTLEKVINLVQFTPRKQ